MNSIWKITIKIFQHTLKTFNFARILVANLLFLATIIIGIVLYIKIHYPSSTTTKGALIMDIVGTIVEQPAIYNKIQQIQRNLFGLSKNQIQENSLFAIIDTLRQAKLDPNITGLILSLKNLAHSDQTSLEYIGKMLQEFKNSGKPIYAISDNYTQTQYFLASYANKIYLTPEGAVNLQGIAIHKLYFKKLLDQLKIDSYIFRVGEYKSAVEPFLRNNMSDEARHADHQWIHQIWKNYLNTISNNRGITSQQIFPGAKKILHDLKKLNGDNAQYALENKLIDEIASNTSIENIMKKTFGWNIKNNTLNAISIYDYHPNIPKETQHSNQIAVIIANGSIIDGEDVPGWIGGDTITEKIRHARLDPKIKALVLRINSPGGSYHASELIREELISTRDSGKPIVVSMGSIAASGGYWISTPANIIIANNNTLTGSIGIFGIITTFENCLNQIGIYNDGIATSPLVNMGISKTLSPEYIQMTQININKAYNHFITTVAHSRHKTLESIDEIAQGRIWTGKDALKYGLIDYIGDFDDAIQKTAELANLKKYQINWYTEKPKIINIILSQIIDILHNTLIKIHFSHCPSLTIEQHQILKYFLSKNEFQFKWNDPNHCYALSSYLK